jgi:starch synthase
MVTPECVPLAKAGGLADVVPALARALRERGCDTRIVMPLYAGVDRGKHGVRSSGSACIHLGAGSELWVGVEEAVVDGVPVWLIDHQECYARTGIYGEPGRGEYGDNVRRFALLSMAALQLCKDRGFIPEVMHLHDWPAALGAVFLKTWDRVGSPLSRTASVLTIHNIGFQGKFPADAFPLLGVSGELLTSDVFEDFGWLNLLKAGIRFADGTTTVSPTHMGEILTPEGGHGLSPYLARRGDDLAGILNGVDDTLWDPARDPAIAARYTASDLSGKAICKADLQRRLGLDLRRDLPLFGMVTRLALQKGIALLQEALPAALEALPIQLVLLGSGEPEYEAFFRALAARFPGRVAAAIGWSEELAHQIEAGSDFFLMPSLYEPCGLNQIYSLKYGTIPVVRGTGGLADTVRSYDPASGEGTGFVFHEPSGRALQDLLRLVVETWSKSPARIERLRRRGMAEDFSWGPAAERYLEAYARAIARCAAWG